MTIFNYFQLANQAFIQIHVAIPLSQHKSSLESLFDKQLFSLMRCDLLMMLDRFETAAQLILSCYFMSIISFKIKTV